MRPPRARRFAALCPLALLVALPLLSGCALLRRTRPAPIYPQAVTPGGVVVQDLIIPEKGIEADWDSDVSIHYVIWTGTGELVDSSYDRGLPIEFRLGAGLVPRGLEEGIVGMRRGGQRNLVVPPALGYGEEGIEGSVPPESMLVVRIELVELR
jgi:peptidylprolyl isomerase